MATPEPIAVDSSCDGQDNSEYYSGSHASEYTTESLTSSIYQYRFENGRRYHAYKDGKYKFPNDETEQERLDIVHHIYLLCLKDKLHLAPIENPQMILDIGTGTGIWAIDAAEYASAKIVGTDLSPIQPSWVPPNVEFQIDDAESDWTFKKDAFDLIHIRHLGGAIKDWDRLISQAYQCTKPGGYIAMAEYEMAFASDDGTVTDDLELMQFYGLVSKAAKLTGRSFEHSAKLKPMLEKAGFIHAHHQPVKIPLGPWAKEKREKEMGAYVLLSAQSGFEAFGIALFTGILKMPLEEAQRIIQATLKQAGNRKYHGYSMHHFYYAQKPLDDDC